MKHQSRSHRGTGRWCLWLLCACTCDDLHDNFKLYSENARNVFFAGDNNAAQKNTSFIGYAHMVLRTCKYQPTSVHLFIKCTSKKIWGVWKVLEAMRSILWNVPDYHFIVFTFYNKTHSYICVSIQHHFQKLPIFNNILHYPLSKIVCFYIVLFSTAKISFNICVLVCNTLFKIEWTRSYSVMPPQKICQLVYIFSIMSTKNRSCHVSQVFRHNHMKRTNSMNKTLTKQICSF